jgi:hypothetical protein
MKGVASTTAAYTLSTTAQDEEGLGGGAIALPLRAVLQRPPTGVGMVLS